MQLHEAERSSVRRGPGGTTRERRRRFSAGRRSMDVQRGSCLPILHRARLAERGVRLRGRRACACRPSLPVFCVSLTTRATSFRASCLAAICRNASLMTTLPSGFPGSRSPLTDALTTLPRTTIPAHGTAEPPVSRSLRTASLPRRSRPRSRTGSRMSPNGSIHRPKGQTIPSSGRGSRRNRSPPVTFRSFGVAVM